MGLMTLAVFRPEACTACRHAVLLLAMLVPQLAAATGDSAERLVDILRPHESDARKLGLMVKVNPFTAIPEGLPECDMNKAAHALRAAYVQHYLTQLSAQERSAALAFFASPQGQDIVRRQHAREATVMQAAASGAAVSETSLEDPPALKTALAAFHVTPTGRRFAGDAIHKQGPGSDKLEALRDEALMRCLQAADAASKSRPVAESPRPTSPPPVKREPARDTVRFVLENQGTEEQANFAVDFYPGTPTCAGTPVRVMQAVSPLSAPDRTHTVEVTPNQVLSFAMRATYSGTNGGESSCSPGALTFVPSSGSEYRATFHERGANCWVELQAFDLDDNRKARRLPVTAKRLKVDGKGQHSCDWGN